jgi:hypothetical protein
LNRNLNVVFRLPFGIQSITEPTESFLLQLVISEICTELVALFPNVGGFERIFEPSLQPYLHLILGALEEDT